MIATDEKKEVEMQTTTIKKVLFASAYLRNLQAIISKVSTPIQAYLLWELTLYVWCVCKSYKYFATYVVCILMLTIEMISTDMVKYKILYTFATTTTVRLVFVYLVWCGLMWLLWNQITYVRESIDILLIFKLFPANLFSDASGTSERANQRSRKSGAYFECELPILGMWCSKPIRNGEFRIHVIDKSFFHGHRCDCYYDYYYYDYHCCCCCCCCYLCAKDPFNSLLRLNWQWTYISWISMCRFPCHLTPRTYSFIWNIVAEIDNNNNSVNAHTQVVARYGSANREWRTAWMNGKKVTESKDDSALQHEMEWKGRGERENRAVWLERETTKRREDAHQKLRAP